MRLSIPRLFILFFILVFFTCIWIVYHFFLGKNVGTVEKVNSSRIVIGNIPHKGFFYKPGFGFFDVKNEISPTLNTKISEVFDYWNENRFNFMNLGLLGFEINKTLDSEKRQIDKAIRFIEGKEYLTFFSDSTKPEDSLKIIKKIIKEKNSPVIVYQKYTPTSFGRGYRLVIGYSEEENKLILNDYYFGNNYKVSYQEFEEMFSGKESYILAFWPSENLSKKRKAPEKNSSYPDRKQIVDAVSTFIANHIDNITYSEINDDSIGRYIKFIEDEKFEKLLPPIYRVYFLENLANMYMVRGKFDISIEIIEEEILPINKDFNESYDGFVAHESFSLGYKNYNYFQNNSLRSYQILMTAYIQKGDRATAQKIYDERMALTAKDKPMHPRLEAMKKLLEEK